MKQLAILISNSGTGTNLQAIIDAIDTQILHARIVSVISDSTDAYGLKRAKKHKIPTAISQKPEDLLPLLQNLRPDFICLTGWKQIILPEVISVFQHRILNVHPGLIPDTIDGKVTNPDGTEGLWNRKKFTTAAIQEFLDKKATYAGSSIHLLTQDFDFGKVLGRAFEKIQPSDTVETLYDRLKKKEHAIYIKALQKLCNT